MLTRVSLGIERMTESNRDPLDDVDAGWDEVSAKVPLSSPPRSIAPVAELEALDDGWSEASQSTPEANPVSLPSGIPPISATVATLSLASDLDTPDDGWDDTDSDDDDSPSNVANRATGTDRSTNGQTSVSRGRQATATKKARRQLEREIKAQQARTKQERQAQRKETKREAEKRHRDEAAQAKAELIREQQAKRAGKPTNAKRKTTKPKPPLLKPNAPTRTAGASTDRALPEQATAVVPLPSGQKPATVQGWMLWAGLVLILTLLGYLVTRR